MTFADASTERPAPFGHRDPVEAAADSTGRRHRVRCGTDIEVMSGAGMPSAAKVLDLSVAVVV